jgi:hypothetical protein
MKVNIELKVGKEFDRFKFGKNRNIDMSHVNELKKEIQQHGFNMAIPLIVKKDESDGKMTILDGQHRFIAVQLLGCEFSYIEVSDIDETQWSQNLSRINKLNKKWKITDFVKMRAEEVPNLKKILPYLNGGKDSFILGYLNIHCLNEVNSLKTDWDFDTSNLDIAIEMFDSLNEIIKTPQRSTSLTIKMMIDKKMDINRLIKNINKQPMNFKATATTKQFMEEIEYFYNYDYKKSNHIYLTK